MIVLNVGVFIVTLAVVFASGFIVGKHNKKK